MAGQHVYGKIACIKIANVLYTKRYCCVCLENCDGLLPLDTCEAVDGGENNMMILTLKEMMEAIFNDTVLNIFRDSSDHMCPACRDSIKYTLSFIEKTKTTAMIFAKYFLTLNKLTVNLLQLTNTDHISSVVFNLNLDVKKNVQGRQSESLKRGNENDCTEVSKKTKVSEERSICEENVHTEVSKQTQSKEDIIENTLLMGNSTPDGSCHQLNPQIGTKENVTEKPTPCPVYENRPCKHENYLGAFEKRKEIVCPECKELLFTVVDIIDHVNRDHFKSKPAIRDVCDNTFQGESLKKNKIMKHGSKKSHQPTIRDRIQPEYVDEDPRIIKISEGPEEQIDVDATATTKLTYENDLKSSTNMEKREIQQEIKQNRKQQESIMSDQECAGCPEVFGNKDDSGSTEPDADFGLGKNEESKRETAIECCKGNNSLHFVSNDTETLQNSHQNNESNDLNKNEVISQNPKISVKSCLMKKNTITNNSLQKTVRFAPLPTIFAEKVSSVDTEIYEEATENIASNPSSDVKLIEENANRFLGCNKKKENPTTRSRTNVDSLNSKSNSTPQVSLNQTVNNLCRSEVRIVLVDVLKKDKLFYRKPQVLVENDVRNKGIASNSLMKDKIVSQKHEPIRSRLPVDKSAPKIAILPQEPLKYVMLRDRIVTPPQESVKSLSPRGKTLTPPEELARFSVETDKYVSPSQEPVKSLFSGDRTVTPRTSRKALLQKSTNASQPRETTKSLLLKDNITRPPQDPVKSVQCQKSSLNKIAIIECRVIKEANIEVQLKQQSEIIETNKEPMKIDKRLIENPKDKNMLDSPSKLVLRRGCVNNEAIQCSVSKAEQSDLLNLDKDISRKSQEFVPTREASSLNLYKEQESDLSDASTDSEETDSNMDAIEEVKIMKKNEKHLLTYEKKRNRTFECPECKYMLYSLKDLIAHMNKNNCKNKSVITDTSKSEAFVKELFQKHNTKILKPVKSSTVKAAGKVHKVSCSHLKTNSHKENKKYECSRCRLHPCKHEKYMKACAKLLRNGIVKCPECKNMLYSPSDLIAHVNKKHSENKYIIRNILNKEYQNTFKNNKICLKPKQQWNCGTYKKTLGNKTTQTALKVNDITSEELVTRKSDTLIEQRALDNSDVTETLEEIKGAQTNQESNFSKSQFQDPLKHREVQNLLKAPEKIIDTEGTEGRNVRVTQSLKNIEEYRRRHECNTCSVVYNSRSGLSLHLKSTGHVLKGTTCCPQCVKRPCKHEKYLLAYEKQKGSGKLECFKCKALISSLRDLIAHVNKDHFNNKLMKCNVCKECVRSKFFENHKRKCKKPPSKKCAKLPVVLLRKEPTEKEIFTKTSTQKIVNVKEPTKDVGTIEANVSMEIGSFEDAEETETPEEKTKDQRPSEKQVPHKSQQPLRCLKCGQICTNEDSYMAHNLEHDLLVVGGVRTEKDNAKENLSKKEMERPEKSMAIMEEKTYICGTCGKTFKHKSWLRLHVKATKHVVKMKLSCPVCAKRPCKHEEYLLAFENKNRNSIQCQVCKDSLDSLTKFIAHVNRDHIESKP